LLPFDRFRRDGLQTIAALSPEEALIEMKRRVLMRPAGTMMKDPRLLLVITNLGLGGAQRAFRDHSVALAKHFSVQEAVFNLEGGNLFPSGNPLTSLEVAGGGGPRLTRWTTRYSRASQTRSRAVSEFRALPCASGSKSAGYCFEQNQRSSQ
jgi:hypothetical protein